MKPYILNYSEIIEQSYTSVKRSSVIENLINGEGINDATLMTAVVESTDPDEVLALSTVITRSLEDCEDPDHILLGSTLMTETVENSDPDEILLDGSTLITKTIEPSDADEVVGFCIPECNERKVFLSAN